MSFMERGLLTFIPIIYRVKCSKLYLILTGDIFYCFNITTLPMFTTVFHGSIYDSPIIERQVDKLNASTILNVQ